MEACQFLITDRLQQSYITTAALRRSRLHPDREMPPEKPPLQTSQQKALQQLNDCEDLNKWIRGQGDSHSSVHTNRFIDVPWTKLTRVQKQTTTIKGQRYLVVPSNEMKVIVGMQLLIQADSLLESDESPLQLDSFPGQRKAELAEALDRLEETVFQNPEVSDSIKKEVRRMLR